MFWTLKNPAFP